MAKLSAREATIRRIQQAQAEAGVGVKKTSANNTSISTTSSRISSTAFALGVAGLGLVRNATAQAISAAPSVALDIVSNTLSPTASTNAPSSAPSFNPSINPSAAPVTAAPSALNATHVLATAARQAVNHCVKQDFLLDRNSFYGVMLGTGLTLAAVGLYACANRIAEVRAARSLGSFEENTTLLDPDSGRRRSRDRLA